MSSRAAPSRFATAALNAAARSASPAGMPASVAAGAGSLPVAGDETARPIVASQKSARFMGCPPFGGPRQYTNSARAFNSERCSFRSGRAAEHARVRDRMGETRVDLLHLLEDLRDAYPGALEETILTEIVANSLDSGARRIQLAADAATAGLVVVDDGSGMRRRELARYHDIASSAKTRGQGIGFAGVGIKLGLLVCEEVLTETRRGKTHVATRWHLASRHRAPWKWIPPEGLVAERGTAVRLKVQNALSPLLDAGFVEAVLRRHYQPLFAPFFTPVLVPWYPRGVTVEVNGRALEPEEVALETAPLEIRAARKRKPSALGYLMRAPEPLPEERRGLAISTLGKVIKHGWDWLGGTPAAPGPIGGASAGPGPAQVPTLHKAGFRRGRPPRAAQLSRREPPPGAGSRQPGPS